MELNRMHPRALSWTQLVGLAGVPDIAQRDVMHNNSSIIIRVGPRKYSASVFITGAVFFYAAEIYIKFWEKLYIICIIVEIVHKN